ncbi:MULTISPECIES: Bug family tripartite tricarboxylate transporter substrate binding protein [Ramlibacter]|uniref:Tripartite tricarboxylate transporter substrate binding protein n=1 Tax=Ramlibacter pinisoli TaxID=2682844 RepID=A0A6N8IV86_9BURK|nr:MULTISPECIES: tripartite tricarboxylate transporter substrate-binding protein [Ramlibacter]MBA2964931.1 tripartite tricarboxylate transporter substrate binding protein [Ramlibacter sp. CGMCC 1.13660]MVQ29896.1 tripartite tricarboxylate transporter substrate binding protein [Ramlibacter pinisoli]
MNTTVLTRRRLLQAGSALAAGALAAPLVALAQPAWPDRPVRVIVPYAAGQGADVLMRLIGQELSRTLNQPLVVENRAGAGGNIGAAAAAKAPADGYTFLFGTNATNAANEFLYPNPGFNAAADFDAVAMVGLLPMVIGSTAADLPANGVAELVAQAKARPGTLNVGLPSTTANVVFAQFVKSAQAPLFAVKYKSSAQSMTDVLGGQIPLVIDTVTAARPHVASGKLKVVGITSLKPSDMLPGVRSVAEQGVPGFDVVAWDALFAPRGTPPEVTQKFAQHVQRALQVPEIRRKLLDIGVEPLFMGPAQLDAFVKDERQKWGATIKAADIRID